MKRLSTLLIAAVVPVAFAAPSLAQEGKVLGVVDNGRTEIVFKAADTSDIDMQKLHTWSSFATEHPDIARTLGYHPSLINDDGWVKKHPELAEFFAAHPDIREAMEEDPGNYVAPPPREEESRAER
ncbi:hypothetical protein [Candidatus Binatus sp.]|uniref:hypothetical protein n=1 Tax=Candidatus Binatus sp. TaxID=2811406 RepID=UPI003BAF23E8